MRIHNKSVESFVALAFKSQYLAYAHIKKTDSQAPYSMISYKQVPLRNFEVEKHIIFNPTRIGSHLHALLCEQCLCNTDIRISIEKPIIFETIIDSHNSSIEELYGPQLKNMVWEDVPIFQNSQSKSMLYVCGISRELLFQYQLLAIKHKLNVTCITTSNLALLSMIHALSTDITDQNCQRVEDIASIIPMQSLHKICSNIPTTENSLLMAELIGLCQAELSYENY